MGFFSDIFGFEKRRLAKEQEWCEREREVEAARQRARNVRLDLIKAETSKPVRSSPRYSEPLTRHSTSPTPDNNSMYIAALQMHSPAPSYSSSSDDSYSSCSSSSSYDSGSSSDSGGGSCGGD